MDMEPDRSALLALRRRYIFALALVALLSLAAQAVVQAALWRARGDAEVVNLAGRQRMLSQRLCKAVLAGRRDETREVLASWTAAHARLARGADLANAGAANSPAVRAAFATIEYEVVAMAAAARRDPPDAEALLAAESRFLTGMEGIVARYQAEARARVDFLVRLELVLCAVLLVVLALEAWLVFRPALRRIEQGIRDRERLQERELEARELQVAADTARTIGQDLHDGLGQTLTAISLQAAALRNRLPTEARGDADLLSRAAVDAIGQARALARRLAPVDIQAAGLEAALRGLADGLGRTGGIACTVDWQADAALPASAGEDLYRIAQEAATNAIRHGRASRIAIVLERDGARLRFSVRDDGRGGPPPAGDGLGLRSMRLRASRLGGAFSAGPAADGGWEVAVLLDAAVAGTGAAQPARQDA
jgi:signal transduction histidine kinase